MQSKKMTQRKIYLEHIKEKKKYDKYENFKTVVTLKIKQK